MTVTVTVEEWSFFIVDIRGALFTLVAPIKRGSSHAVFSVGVRDACVKIAPFNIVPFKESRQH